MITTVTITGADESIEPNDLVSLSKKYPFVEWGILISFSSMGSRRFPSLNWLRELVKVKEANPEMKFSCHLCGRWVKELLLNKAEFVGVLGEEVWAIFDRVQINTHAEEHPYHLAAFDTLKGFNKEIIFQRDDINNELLEVALKEGVRCSTLFDLSHGIGILPKEWPTILTHAKCGYAGGLSPENLDEQINLIISKTNGTSFWIDMETHVRSDMDKQFDLQKVEKCLEISERYVIKMYGGILR